MAGRGSFSFLMTNQNNEEEILLTAEGFAELKKEYENLIAVERPKIAKELEAARSLGDLSENAAYAEIRRRQSFMEGRIAELEEIIKRARVSEKTNSDKAQLGSRVTVHLDNQEDSFLLVSANEADLSKGKVSLDSPLGKALLSQKAGKKVKVATPVGEMEYTILRVE